MKRLNTLLVLGILAALILAMVAVIPASAYPPDRYEYSIEDEGTLTCYDTELTWHQEGMVQGMDHCNHAFEVCGATEHTIRGTFTLTNPNNDRTLILRGGVRVRMTWVTYYDTLYEVTGASYMGTIPGYGPVFGSPGRHVTYETCQGEWPDNWVCQYETLFDSGPTFDNMDAICNYMAYGK